MRKEGEIEVCRLNRHINYLGMESEDFPLISETIAFDFHRSHGMDELKPVSKSSHGETAPPVFPVVLSPLSTPGAPPEATYITIV